MRPGVNVTTRDNAPPSTVPTDVGTGFMVAVTEAGAAVPSSINLVQNMDEFIRNYAPSQGSYAGGLAAYNGASTFFSEGGNRLYVSRVFGPAAAAATVSIPDSSSAVSLVVTARGPGEWGNNIDVKVDDPTTDPSIAVGSYRLKIIDHTTGSTLYASPDLVDQAAAISWASSTNVQISAGASALDPAPATKALATGTNDIPSITNTQWQNACNGFSYVLGPGLMFAPGVTTTAVYGFMAEAARRDLRIAILDGPDTPTANTLITSAKSVPDSTMAHSRYSGMFAPWLTVAGATSGTYKKVPPSPAVVGRFCKNMGLGYSANEPAAGELGRLLTVLQFTQTYSDSDRATLNANGVNVIRDIYGSAKIYGWRTTADPINDPRWISLSNSILQRQIVAECNAVGERFIFREIDGGGRLIGEFNGALVGEVCLPLFLSGSLYGDKTEDAYKVDTGPSVNTVATISNNELHAVISVRIAPFGEEVDIEIVKYLVTEAIPA